MRKVRRSPAPPPAVRVGPPWLMLGACVFCLLLGVAGLVAFWPTVSSLAWEKAPCTVLECRQTDDARSDAPFSVAVRYSFLTGGQTRESTRLGRTGWKAAAESIRLVRQLRAQPQTFCHWPQGDPTAAVLLRPEVPPGAPALAAFGFGMAWMLWTAHRRRHDADLWVRLAPPLTLFFLGTGVAVLVAFSLPAWRDIQASASWEKRPARIAWVVPRRVGSGQNSRLERDVCYEYEAAGATWRHNRVTPGNLGRHRPPVSVGDSPTCFVDPAAPERAVLIRETGAHFWLTFAPLPLLLLGGWTGLIALRRSL